MSLDFDVEKLYSIKDLEAKGLEIVRFYSSFSIHYYNNEFYIFKHYKPTPDKPSNRFGYKTKVYTQNKDLKEDKKQNL